MSRARVSGESPEHRREGRLGALHCSGHGVREDRRTPRFPGPRAIRAAQGQGPAGCIPRLAGRASDTLGHSLPLRRGIPRQSLARPTDMEAPGRRSARRSVPTLPMFHVKHHGSVPSALRRPAGPGPPMFHVKHWDLGAGSGLTLWRSSKPGAGAVRRRWRRSGHLADGRGTQPPVGRSESRNSCSDQQTASSSCGKVPRGHCGSVRSCSSPWSARPLSRTLSGLAGGAVAGANLGRVHAVF